MLRAAKGYVATWGDDANRPRLQHIDLASDKNYNILRLMFQHDTLLPIYNINKKFSNFLCFFSHKKYDISV